MLGASNITLLRQILERIRDHQTTIQAMLSQMERAITRHNGKFEEAKQQFSHINRRFSHSRKRLNDIQAEIRDVTNQLKSVIRLEASKQAGILEAQVGRQLQSSSGL